MDSACVYLKTYGCSTNLADGEVLAGCLADSGYTLVKTIEEADVAVYNTCAVKGPTEDRVIEALRRVPTAVKLVVCGCLPLIHPERLSKLNVDAVAGPAAGDRIANIVERVLNGERIVSTDRATEAKPSLKLPRIRRNPVVGVVPISYGCLGECAYCCVVFSRGHLRSYTIEEIADRCASDVAMGVRELWLTSQDTASYGEDINTNLAALLDALCKIRGDFRIRVGMMTPIVSKTLLGGIVQAYNSAKILKFVHLPVQSGDDRILRLMKRPYSADQFVDVVKSFRKEFPNITLATDIICGFPGETQEAFERTLKMIKEVRPDIVNVSRFFPRPGTAANNMRSRFLDPSEINRRSRRASELAKEVAAEQNRRWLGWTGDILVDEIGRSPETLVGRNFAYKPVVVKDVRQDGILGTFLKVKVTDTRATFLEGRIV